MKRIIITRSNPVDPDSRVEKEANSLVKAGYDVTLIVWDRNSDYKIKYDVKQLSDCEVKRIRFGSKAEYGAGFKSLVPYLKFQVRLFKWLFQNRKEYDLCHFCDFDTAFTGSIAARLLHKKYIFDLFDYLSTNADTLFRKIVKYFEDGIINHADASIICTEKRKEQIKDSHPKRLVIIHNSPDEIELGSLKVKGNPNKVKIVYVGILQQKQRMLKELVDTISQMDNAEFHVGGFGELEDYLRKSSEKYDNIFFYGKLPYKDTLSLEQQCDIVTAIYNPIVGNSLYAAPNKFYEGLMFGKPLIMVKGTGMSEVVGEQGFGVLIDCNEQSLKNGLGQLIGRSKEWLDIQTRMSNMYHEMYSWRIMEKRLTELYSELLK